MPPADLPWRGPGPGRPELPLPPGRLPLRRGGAWRKRWRYVGLFADELLACAARVQVGPVGQTFWALWDRDGKRIWEQTKLRLPGARGEVWAEGPDEPGLRDYASDDGSVQRIEAKHPEAGDVRAFLRFPGGGRWVESVCPAGDPAYVWTRKRVGTAVEADIRVGERRWRTDARGVEDESAGFHPRHTVWNWSAGVGTTADGRAVGWNLVAGVNDPPRRSERAIWVEGEPSEPGPVEFEGLEAIRFDDGAELRFAAECERRREERRPLVRYSYRQPFGTFTGTLPGGLALAEGVGVMEHHDAHW
ncbi:MAG: DUF2804 domain-containing protein [Solirubrobacterales bacterium]